MKIADSSISCCTNLYELPLTQILLGDSFHPGGLALTKLLAQKALINRHSIVLDVATGKGTSANYIATQYGAKVFALDLGIENLKKMVTAPRSFPVVGSAESLPFADSSFDVVLCECSLCLFSNKLQSLKEIHRVLKPDGFIAISDIYVNQALPSSLNNELSQWLCIANALSSQQSQRIIASAGFSNIRFYDESKYLINTVAEIEEKVGRLKNLTILKREIATLNEFPLQELATFITEGKGGYYLLTGRKKGAARYDKVN